MDTCLSCGMPSENHFTSIEDAWQHTLLLDQVGRGRGRYTVFMCGHRGVIIPHPFADRCRSAHAAAKRMSRSVSLDVAVRAWSEYTQARTRIAAVRARQRMRAGSPRSAGLATRYYSLRNWGVAPAPADPIGWSPNNID